MTESCTCCEAAGCYLNCQNTVAKLRAVLAAKDDRFEQLAADYDRLILDLVAKDAEIAKLRGALTQCAEWIREKHERPDCFEILLNARAALGQIPPEPFAGTCVWKKAGTPSKDNIYNTSCGVVRCLPQDGICPCCNRRVEVKS